MLDKMSFVVSVIYKKENGEPVWLYLSIIDKGGDHLLCWTAYEDQEKTFNSTKAARDFFNKHRETLLVKGGFDMKTLGIRKRIYKLVENL